ncbi:MAG: Ig-like domain-containing protein [Panacagrimonas sp.]
MLLPLLAAGILAASAATAEPARARLRSQAEPQALIPLARPPGNPDKAMQYLDVHPSGAAKRATQVAKILSKVDGRLDGLYREHSAFRQKSGTAAAKSSAPFRPATRAVQTSGERVLIDATAVADGAKLLVALRALGLQRGSVFNRRVSGWLPITALPAVGSLANLRFARASYAATRTGSVGTQGDDALRSDLLRGAYATDGSGLTVGILSDSFNCRGGMAADIGSGDLPFDTTVIREIGNCSLGTEEGRAMAQIVHDVAPGATILFHTASDGQAAYAQAIKTIRTAGAHIIVDDVFYFDEPFFQDGILAQAVDAVTAMGAMYFSAAGNDGRNSWEGRWKESVAFPKFLNFDSAGPTDFGNQLLQILPNEDINLSVQWDQPDASQCSGGPCNGPATDLDVLLTDPSGTVVAASLDRNVLGSGPGATGQPVEILSFTNTNPANDLYLLQIVLKSGPAPNLVKYVNFGKPTNYTEFATHSPTLVGHPNAAGAVAVGAAAYFFTPRFGVSPPLLEGFSSAGGVPILFDTAGRSIARVVRAKPEITAPDGGNNTFFGEDGDFDGIPNFFGTSAAAPHAAGVAALMLQRIPSLTRARILTAMQATAIDILARNDRSAIQPGTTRGFDVDSGPGLLNAEAAMNALATPTATGDRFTVIENSAKLPLNVLLNDRSPVNALKLVSVSKPSKGGTASLNASRNRVLFKPRPGFVGIDKFNYTVTNGHVRKSATATIVVSRR